MSEQPNTSKAREASETGAAPGAPRAPVEGAARAPDASAPGARTEAGSEAGSGAGSGDASPALKGERAVALPDMESTFAKLVSEDEASSSGKSAGKGKLGKGNGKGAKGPDVKGGDTDKEAKRPRRGRVAIEFAECTLGEIVNASPTGLRARYKGSRKNLPQLEDRFNMQVQTPDGPAFVRARVAWIKRVGLRTHDIGVHFVPADAKSATRLSQLATMAGRAIVITEETGGTTLRAG